MVVLVVESVTEVMVEISYCGNGSHGVLGGSGNHGVLMMMLVVEESVKSVCVAVLVKRMVISTLETFDFFTIRVLLSFVHVRDLVKPVCAVYQAKNKPTHPYYPSMQPYM